LGKGGIGLSHKLEMYQARARYWQLSDFSEDAAAIAAHEAPAMLLREGALTSSGVVRRVPDVSSLNLATP